MWEILQEWSIPSAIVGLIVWLFKRYLDKRERERREREERIEMFMRHITLENRATHILAMATAKAVQRIPDAHCNGDMTKALEDAEKAQKGEKDFIVEQGLDRIWGGK